MKRGDFLLKILVTGGAGFIASHVVDGYVSLGHDVAVVDDLSRGSRANLNPKARFYLGDIQDTKFVESIIAAERPAIVNHHAAQMDVRRGVREPLFDASVNILGSLNILQSAIANGVTRVVYISTAGAAYGEPDILPVPETYPINPITPYGVSKHTVEHYLFTYSFLYGLKYVVLRYGNVYGPRQSSQGEAGVFAIFSEQLLAGIQPVIYGDGGKVRDYVYVDDVVTANITALERGNNEIFNVANGVETTDQEVFDLVKRLLGKSEVKSKYAPRRPGEIDKIKLDIRKARESLGWTPRVTLEEGARHTVEYFRNKAAEKLSELRRNAP
jgi:UDP-glucose 4-epimerase